MVVSPVDQSNIYASHLDFYSDVYGASISAVRSFGSGGGFAYGAEQTAGDWSDAATPDLVLAWLSSSKPVNFSMDLGTDRFQGVQRRNDAILVAPNTDTSIQMDKAHGCRMLALPYGQLLAVAQSDSYGLPNDGDFGLLHSGLLRHTGLSCLLDTVWREAISGGPHGHLYADGLVLQLVAVLLRMRDHQASAANRGGLAPWQKRRTTEFLQAHLAEDIALDQLAGIAQLSSFHFARAFKQSTGLPPYAYLRRLRSEQARELLAETDLSVTEIAASVGYETPQAFARMFRSEVGTSPSEYRRQRWS